MAGAPQQQQNTDNSLAILWGITSVFVVIGMSWFFFHTEIVSFILKIRIGEARLLGMLFPQYKAWVAEMRGLDPSRVRVDQLVALSRLVGHYLRFPIFLGLLFSAWSIYRSRATLQFNQQYDMKTLAAAEQANWSQISPVVQLDLVNTPIDEGPWAMGLTPFQFAEREGLLNTSMTQLSKHSIKKDKARQVLIEQLGEPWHGLAELPLPTKALFAVFAARALHQMDEARQLLHQISISAKENLAGKKDGIPDSLNFSGVDQLLSKYAQHPLVTAVSEKHAYVLGVMASMLVFAREGGVLPSAEFLWLKPTDRRLWFMLNCVGRKTAYTEVAGPFSHWIAECAIGRKLKVPIIDSAVEAIELSLQEVSLLKQK